MANEKEDDKTRGQEKSVRMIRTEMLWRLFIFSLRYDRAHDDDISEYGVP